MKGFKKSKAMGRETMAEERAEGHMPKKGMKSGGKVRGGGAATKGLKFGKNG